MQISPNISEKELLVKSFSLDKTTPFQTKIMGYRGHINELTWQIKVQRNGNSIVSLRQSIL